MPSIFSRGLPASGWIKRQQRVQNLFLCGEGAQEGDIRTALHKVTHMQLQQYGRRRCRVRQRHLQRWCGRHGTKLSSNSSTLASSRFALTRLVWPSSVSCVEAAEDVCGHAAGRSSSQNTSWRPPHRAAGFVGAPLWLVCRASPSRASEGRPGSCSESISFWPSWPPHPALQRRGAQECPTSY